MAGWVVVLVAALCAVAGATEPGTNSSTNSTGADHPMAVNTTHSDNRPSHDAGNELKGNTGPVENNCKNPCVNGKQDIVTCKCSCNYGFDGGACDVKSVCTNDCNGRGTCEMGFCRCNEGFCGQDCSESGDVCVGYSTKCTPLCVNGGVCMASATKFINGFECMCPTGFDGVSCEQKKCPNDCSMHGRCDSTTGTCTCKSGYNGTACTEKPCPVCADSLPCGDGCIAVNATCHKKPGCATQGLMRDFVAEAEKVSAIARDEALLASNDTVFPPYATDNGPIRKKVTNCSVVCSSREACMDGRCRCKDGFRGNKCEVRTCPDECSGKGVCRRGMCLCDAGFAGEGCAFRVCANNCSNHGVCVNITNGNARLLEDGNAIHNKTLLEQLGLVGVDGVKGVVQLEGFCVCESGFTGQDCSKTLCLNNCSGHGFCNQREGVCYCYPGWSNANCNMSVCPNECSGNGECVQGFCKCLHGFAGDSCSVRVRMETEIDAACKDVDCNGNGVCKRGSCFCHLPFHGRDCTKNLCPGNCGHGNCSKGRGCVCQSGWMGIDCKMRNCPNDCSGDGVCEAGVCKCDVGLMGEGCDEPYCPDNCNNHGSCSNGTCVCKRGYSGIACAHMKCGTSAVDCSGQGACVDGLCKCDAEWTGSQCDQVRCPADCSVNGSIHGRCKTGRCECFPGFEGQNCSVISCPDDCSGHGECLQKKCDCDEGWRNDNCGAKMCVNNCSSDGNSTEAGWCRDDGKCVCSHKFYGVDCSIRRPARHKCAAECVGKCLDDGACQDLWLKVKHQNDKENLLKYRQCYMGCTETCNDECKAAPMGLSFV